jgi:orotidine-5'-phosphate decarboxylase
MIDARQRLIVALDVADIAAARRTVRDLDGVAGFFKVGLTLQLAAGVEDFVRELIAEGKRVFLDYKYYDIPETVRRAVERAAGLGVSFLTVHGSSGTIRGAVEGRGSASLKLLTVTVLTSMEAADIEEMGHAGRSVEELVLFRARKALEAGCDGVIASGHEARKIKEVSAGKLLVVTPGIRPGGYSLGDQKRAMTPREAILEGADYLVIGRPVTEPGDMPPREAARRVVDEMQAAFGQ